MMSQSLKKLFKKIDSTKIFFVITKIFFVIKIYIISSFKPKTLGNIKLMYEIRYYDPISLFYPVGWYPLPPYNDVTGALLDYYLLSTTPKYYVRTYVLYKFSSWPLSMYLKKIILLSNYFIISC